MGNEQLIWIAAAFTGAFGSNVAVLRLVLIDKLRHPLRIAIFLDVIYAITIGGFIWRIVDFWVAAGVAAYCFLFLLLLAYILKQRDVGGVSIGEKLAVSFHVIDMQICYILNDISSGEATIDTIRERIGTALQSILDQIVKILRLDHNDSSEICILSANQGNFKVGAKFNITVQQILKIEQQFQYGDNPKSIAGLAASRKEPIYIPDLSKKDNPDRKYCCPIEGEDNERGSIIAIPISRGVGETENTETLGVLYAKSARNHTFEAKEDVLLHFASKIEELFYCERILSRIPRRMQPKVHPKPLKLPVSQNLRNH